MIDLIFLGTACMAPTKERSHPAVLLSYGAENLLFDCGEGTQRQLKIAGIKPARITKLLISHWHGDHILGIPGLMSTMGAEQHSGVLDIYGPKGTKEYISLMVHSFVSKDLIEFRVHEVLDGKIFENEDFALYAAPLKHSAPCIGYSFVEKEKRKMNLSACKKLNVTPGPLMGKLQAGQSITLNGRKITPEEATTLVPGKKIVYLTDTRPCNNALKLAEKADLLITDATYKNDQQDKAESHFHLTTQEATQIANEAGVKKLVLTHISQRYKNAKELEQEARQYFDDTLAAVDFMKVSV